MRRNLTLTIALLSLLPTFATAETFVVMGNGGNADKLAANIQAAGGTIVADLQEINVVIVESDDANFASTAAGYSNVRSVTADMSLQLIDPMPAATNISLLELAANPPTSGEDDFLFDLQWGHDAINTPEAWETGARGAGVRVAVLDSGIDAGHPDIAPNLNLALSTSFVPGEGVDIQPGFYFNHGTHVAGIIGAADNGIGTIGVAPEVELVAVKVLSEVTGSGSFAGIIQGIVYAANIDADIINMSLGADIPHNAPGVAELFVATGRATTYATQQGTLVIAAAGNDARDLDHDASLKSFPAELPHVVSVSATAPVGWALDPGNTNLDNLASFSNYGQNGIDLAAPGGDFILPGNDACTIVVTRPCWVFDLVFSTISEGWGWAAGTSMAAPHAAGVAALIISKNGGPMSPAHVLRELQQSADDLGKPGNDDAYGKGRVNALSAVN